jgi:putative SOS response-associated peptidase YedK
VDRDHGGYVRAVCGRATLSSPAEDIAELFDVDPIDIGPPRFNIAPTQPMVTVRASAAGGSESDASRKLAVVRWGLIPWWAKPEESKKVAARCIQARAETVRRAPAFRDAFRRHRCLVVVDGFFEWKTLPDGKRVPHHVRRSHAKPFAIAGVWDSWTPPPADGAPRDRIESCAVLTTPSGGSLATIHDRMPLVLEGEHDWDSWLGTEEEAERLLEQSPAILEERARDLVMVPVSTWVNDVRHDDPRCIEPSEPSDPAEPQVDFGFGSADRMAKTRRRTTG